MGADLIQKIVVSVLAAGVGDSTVAVDVPQDAVIENVFWNFHGSDMDALDDGYTVELSFASSNTLTNNDSRISIFEISESQQFLTSGGGANGVWGFLPGLDIPVFGGERLHVHTAVSGGTSAINGSLYLYYRTRGAPPRRTARRRR